MPQDDDFVNTGADLTDFETIALIAFGSNVSTALGSPAEMVSASLAALESTGFTLRARSRFFRTPAFPHGSGPDFVNACAAFETPWPADRVLEHLHRIEARFGRKRKKRWAPRTLDLDLIALGGAVTPSRDVVDTWMSLPLELQTQTAPDQLILPHPRLHERAFVLIPLADVAAGWRHPITGNSVAEMVAALPDYLTDEVTIYDQSAEA